MTPGILTRRNVLIGSAAVLGTGLAATGASVVACNMADREGAFLETLPRLFVAVPRIPDVDPVGGEIAGKLGRDGILDAIRRRPAITTACTLTCDATRLSQLRRAFRTDYAEGRHIIAHRWILSETEALIAAAWTVAPVPSGRQAIVTPRTLRVSAS